MQNSSTSIEVKCECKIPFHAELVNYIHKLLVGAIDEHFDANKMFHTNAVTQALRNKLVFIKLDFAHTLKRVRPKLLAAFKKTFKKELIGTIKVGKHEITLILL